MNPYVIAFSDPNCPFCYATEERLHRLGLEGAGQTAPRTARATPTRRSSRRRGLRSLGAGPGPVDALGLPR